MPKALKLLLLTTSLSVVGLAWHRHYESMSNCDVNSISSDASSYVGNIEDIKVSHTRKGCVYTIKGSSGIAKFDNNGNLMYFKKKR